MSTRSLTPMPLGFHGDTYLLKLVDELAARSEVFLETGSNVGSTLAYVAQRFPKLDCHACEPDAAAHAVAVQHACTRPHVVLRNERSQEFLQRIEREHSELLSLTPLAWLDAHDHGFEWPLRDEVSFFTRKFASGFLLIDDFRVPHDARFGFDAYDGHECSFEHVRASIAPGVAWRLYYPAYSEHTSPWHPLRGWGLLQFGPRPELLERLDEKLPEVCQQAEASAGSVRASTRREARPARRGAERARSSSTPSNVGSGVCAHETSSITFYSGTQAVAHVGAPTTLAGEQAPASSTTRRAAPSPAARAAQGDMQQLVNQLRADLAANDGSAEAWNDLGACLALLGDVNGALEAIGEALLRDPLHAQSRKNLKYILRATRASDGRALAIAPGAWGRTTQRDPYADLRELVETPRPLIVDGGANRGETVAILRGLFPDARIHAFEPIPELADGIRKRFADDRELVVHRAALAAQGGLLRFHQLRQDMTSSALRPSALKRRYHGEQVDVQRELDVLALPLSDVVQEPIDVLKLDLQGYELEALKGLGEKLRDVRTILSEVEFVPLYDRQPLFADVDAFLRAAGFRLFHLYHVWSHPDGQVTTADALYVNERHYA